MRLGSHYVGQMYGNRTKINDSEYGWLGSIDTTLDHRGRLRDTTGTPPDNWLDTAFGTVNSSTPIMKKWTVATDSLGVDQYSIFGYMSADVSKPVFTCLGCHTPHGAAQGTIGRGPVDNIFETTLWDGELLLATNANSYICYTCHLPAGTHPVDYPANTASAVRGDSSDYNWVTRIHDTINIFDSAKPDDVVRHTTDIGIDPYNTLTVFLPANYPNAKMVCESCHSAHSANSRWGDMILEGDTTREFKEPKAATQGFDPFGDVGLHNKRPIDTATSDSTKDINDRPTCEMCHPQGK
jgi:hypothetical protein